MLNLYIPKYITSIHLHTHVYTYIHLNTQKHPKNKTIIK